MAKTNHDAGRNPDHDHFMHAFESEGSMFLVFPFCTVNFPMEYWSAVQKDFERLIAARTPKEEKKNDSSKKQPEKRS
jgi:hypothetical protein